MNLRERGDSEIFLLSVKKHKYIESIYYLLTLIDHCSSNQFTSKLLESNVIGYGLRPQASVPIQFLIQLLPRELSGRSMKLTTHLHLRPRFRMHKCNFISFTFLYSPMLTIPVLINNYKILNNLKKAITKRSSSSFDNTHNSMWLNTAIICFKNLGVDKVVQISTQVNT